MVDDTVPEYDDWRELARRIQAEQDPIKMTALVEQLIHLLDQEKKRRGLHPPAPPQ